VHLERWKAGSIGAALALGLALGVSAAPDEADELVRSLEAHHAGLRTLTASFTQAYRSVATGQEIVERGRLYVRRPQLRFDYRKPDRKVFLVEADGTTLAYVPADRSAVRGRLPDEAPHLRLLRGESGLLDDFAARTVTLKSPMVAGSTHLKLVPRSPHEAIDTVYLEVSPGGRTVHRVLVLDRQGNESDLVFEKVRENPGLRAGTFELDLPSGVSVRDLAAPETGR
jgi:outer membrane lipoprotein-sorting protein